MKKFIAIITAALIFSVFSTTVSAAGPMHRRNVTDADGDGICDNYNANGSGCKRRSNCDRNFTDADGDGICDNAKYSIRYRLNGGKNNKKNPSCYYNTTKTIRLKKPHKKGYTFKGWYADKQYEKKVAAIKKGSSGTKTLYAKWEKK